jgi:hypothetical protein
MWKTYVGSRGLSSISKVTRKLAVRRKRKVATARNSLCVTGIPLRRAGYASASSARSSILTLVKEDANIFVPSFALRIVAEVERDWNHGINANGLDRIYLVNFLASTSGTGRSHGKETHAAFETRPFPRGLAVASIDQDAKLRRAFGLGMVVADESDLENLAGKGWRNRLANAVVLAGPEGL